MNTEKPKKETSPRYVAWIKTHRCIFCGGLNADPHHLRREDGQPRRSLDVGNLVPVCRKHHTELHDNPKIENELEKTLRKHALKLKIEWESKKD